MERLVAGCDRKVLLLGHVEYNAGKRHRRRPQSLVFTLNVHRRLRGGGVVFLEQLGFLSATNFHDVLHSIDSS